ncbi:MAG TPA: HD domain-containing protein [Terriglobales bacterium]|nr:HD domain-containing protein [Terriglobales bacterium]
MTTAPSLSNDLRDLYADEFGRIQQEFSATGDGRAAVLQRTSLVEKVVLRLWNELFGIQSAGFAMIALGGFGRKQLFPYSDIDLLFLHAQPGGEELLKGQVRDFSQRLWDLRLKLSLSSRTFAECDRFDPNNIEFAISLLDCRYLAGDPGLYADLHDKLVPRLVARESRQLVQSLVEITEKRHCKYGKTVFHLEPNIKDGPGGLRDCNLIGWLGLISAMDKLCAWPDSQALADVPGKPSDDALQRLLSLRCFLHFRHDRDDNTLTWEAQEDAAARAIGMPSAEQVPTPDWMRLFFSQARSIHRACRQLLEDVPAGWSSLYRQFQQWRSRLSNADFSVVHGRVFLQQPSALDAGLLLRLFQFLARHGLKLSSALELQVAQTVPLLSSTPLPGIELWPALAEMLRQPYAADALRTLHSLQLLTILLPELKIIDALVVRDFYHRFTVDEHSFVAIDNLHRLAQTSSEWDRRYAELLREVEQPELLYLSLLLHDVGKGVPGNNHITASVEIASQCLDRLALEPQERETVLFLIANHLEISAALRRDIFDPSTVAALAEKAAIPERLKMLCLLTYADVKAVNPDALTPWKAENLWQLYISASNHLSRSVDQAMPAGTESDYAERFRMLPPSAAKKLKNFLEGLPRRYVASYSISDVLQHWKMAEHLREETVQLHIERRRHWYELTVVTADRPFLFATIAGVLTAWGMSIVKANAFSNHQKTVVDIFYFTDPYRTLELNLPEWERLKRELRAVLAGEEDLERMLSSRARAPQGHSKKVAVQLRVDFDNASSSRSTLLQLIARDRPGLLHRLSSLISHEHCNIEIALVETEGQMAIDVFYLTSGSAKLDDKQQHRLRAALLEELKDM